MIKHVLQSIEGVATFPVVSLLMFLVAFLLVLYLTWRMTPAEVERASRMPLDDDWNNGESNNG